MRLLMQRVRVASLLATILVPAGTILELFARPGFVDPVLQLRLGFAVLTALIFAATFVRRFERLAIALSLLVTIVVAVGIELIVFTVAGPTSGYYAGLIVLVLTVGLLFPWTALESAAAGALIFGSYVVPALVLTGPEAYPELFMNAYMLGNGVLIAIVANHLGTALFRREQRARHELENRSAQLAETTARLEDSVGRLQELDRLKDRFFANVSHELRTPLTLILAPVDEILGQGVPDDELRHGLEIVRRNGRRLLRLITDLLDLSRLGAGRAQLHSEVLALGSFLTGLRDEFAPLAARRRISLELEGEAPELVLADPDKLGTIVRNLLSNALKFTNPGGRVVVRRGEHEDGWFLEVSDTGIGIPRDQLDGIFERFIRVEADDRRVGGTGIGLALVQELTALHGGTIEVSSRVGEGSTFRVSLPRQHVPAGEPVRERPEPENPWLAEDGEDETRPEPAGAPQRSERILIAEDEPDMLRFLSAFLGRVHPVLQAADGARALELARRERPDLIVADLMMPGLSGYELTRALKDDPATSAIPVVILTARRDPQAILRGFEEGADDWVEKPFHPKELLARVHAQLRLRALTDQLAESRKAAMLGTLSAGLAHEVRNPAASILAGVAAIRKRLPPDQLDPRTAEVVDIIEDSARRISGLVGDLLDFSHLRRNGDAEWDPEDSLERALRLLAWRAEDVRVERDYAPVPPVPGDPARLEQVVMTLLDNAMRAADGDGTVRIGLHSRDGRVVLTIRDDGPGIPPEIAPHLFDPFFTTRPVGQGTGLGLYVARQVVESHGGRIHFETAPGRGTCFEVHLPAKQEAAPSEPEADPTQQERV